MSTFSFNIATGGVRAGHRYLATLGYNTYQIDIRITPTDSGGGGGNYSGHTEEKRRIYDPLYSLIHIEFQGKEENFLFYAIRRMFDVDIEVTLTRQDGKALTRKDDAIIEVLLKNMNSLNTIKETNRDSIIQVILNIPTESKPQFTIKEI